MKLSDGAVALDPEDQGYAEELYSHNLTVEPRPRLVVGAASPADVSAAVATATARGLSVGAQGSGHGRSVPGDGVLVTTKRLNRVDVDPEARRARIGAGARWRDVLPVLGRYGLAPLNGSSPEVGVTGYTLGGGIAMLGRQHGYAADHVRRVQLVTADAEIREVTADSHPDLFYAVRGGRGHFGIATELEIDLFPVTDLVGGGLYFDGAASAEVLATYVDWAANLPRSATTSVVFLHMPDVDEVQVELRGRFVVHLRFALFGSNRAAADALLTPMRAAGPVLLDTVAVMPYTTIGTIHHEPVGPYRTHETGFFTGPLRRTDLDTVRAAAAESLLVEVRHHAGAYADEPADPNPVGGRDAEFTVFAASVIEPDSGGDPSRVDDFRARFAGNDRGSVLNFLGVGATADQTRSAYSPDAWERLLTAKRTWDPDNTFRVELPLRPRSD